MLQNPHVLLTFGNVQNPLHLPRKTASEHQKVLRNPIFYTFDFEMCFSPQRRALFQHLNFQKWSEPLVLLTFWLRNVLRATTACTFSTSQLPKVVRTWCVFPTCQVRVVRFYHGCSPPPRLAILLLLLPLLLRQHLLHHLCLAPLDLNLGPSQLSGHRWTSTWDLPSSVCTAGLMRIWEPQAGAHKNIFFKKSSLWLSPNLSSKSSSVWLAASFISVSCGSS